MPFELPVVTPNDLVTIAFLVFLEGVLSIDNALVLALIVKPLPKDLQKKALTYGLVGAFVFRIIAIGMASYLMQWEWVKFVGGAYLLYLAIKYWVDKRKDEVKEAKAPQSQARAFWMTIVVVELTDVMFAIDSILTAVALTNKLWVVITGGIIGLLAMRFAAGVFIKLLDKFPRFEPTAYILVALVGSKLLVEGFAHEFEFKAINFHDPQAPAFWTFWACMTSAVVFGFTKPKGAKAHGHHHGQGH
jgi:YkoY family integral membrane protein